MFSEAHYNGTFMIYGVFKLWEAEFYNSNKTYLEFRKPGLLALLRFSLEL